MKPNDANLIRRHKKYALEYFYRNSSQPQAHKQMARAHISHVVLGRTHAHQS